MRAPRPEEIASYASSADVVKAIDAAYDTLARWRVQRDLDQPVTRALVIMSAHARKLLLAAFDLMEMIRMEENHQSGNGDLEVIVGLGHKHGRGNKSS